jgi:hypothetical protein
MRNIIIIVTILFLVAGICYASSGRNEAIEYLHKDKASMLDVGLLRLEQVALIGIPY